MYLEVEENVKTIVEEIARRRSIRIDFQKGLFSGGQLSSLAAVELIVALEKKFGGETKRVFKTILDLDSLQRISTKIHSIGSHDAP